jgi:hypothetical protein
VYIKPLFEYACELWDNCGIGNSQKLEQLQLPEFFQAYLFLPKLKLYMERQVWNYHLRGYFNLRRMLKCFIDTLLLILSTWIFHLASLLNVTPKCL